MKKAIPILSLIISIIASPAFAQTEVHKYVPGITEEGITYFLPNTQVRVAFTIEKSHYAPGEYSEYAERYLRLKQVTKTAYDIWQIKKVEVYTYGVANPSKAYTIKVRTKTSAPLVSLTDDGRLLSVNAQSESEASNLPKAQVVSESTESVNPDDYKTEDILAAGSKAKMAELTANEIYDIRENRGLLTKGQADFMPKDGEQLRLMLNKLDVQEKALLQLFTGSVKKETCIYVYDVLPQKKADKVYLCNFSQYLGFVDADDPAGAPIYYSVDPQSSFTAAAANTEGKSKKEQEDLRYIVPNRVAFKVFDDHSTLASGIYPMAQFGRVEHLGGDLFNKKYETRVWLSPTTGGIVKIEGEQPR